MKAEDRTKELTIRNKYIFAAVMRNKEICKGFLQRVLPEIQIGDLSYVEPEKTFDVTPDAHGIRVDVYAADGTHIYDVEMQVQDRGDLPRRSRFSSALLDETSLGRGKEYKALPDSFVIFICIFDPFGRGRRKYTFRNVCTEDPDLELGDGSVKVFFERDRCSRRNPAGVEKFS